MKSRAFCFSALIVWLLVFLTVFSFSVENWMMPVVYPVKSVANPKTGYLYNLPAEVVLYDIPGHKAVPGILYEIKEIANDPSLAVVEPKEVELRRIPSYPASSSAKVQIENQHLAGRFVKFSSKPLQEGKKVTVVERQSGQPKNYWVAFFSRDLDPLPAGLSREAANGNALLLAAETDYPVFVEDMAKSLFLSKDYTVPEGLQIYSLTEVEHFFRALPLVAAVLSLFLLALTLWAHSFHLSKNVRKHKKALCINGGIGAALLAGIILLLRFVVLPSSLMPVENIFDISHYTQEFSRIFSALQGFADSGNAAAAATLSQARAMIWASLGILVLGLAAGIGLLFSEAFRKSPKKHTARHRVVKI